MPYILSPRAQADLGEIWDQTLSRWGSAQAERYLRQIQGSSCSRTTRGSGDPPAPYAGYRKHASGAQVIFYREIGTGIDVVWILHRRMDVPPHL